MPQQREPRRDFAADSPIFAEISRKTQGHWRENYHQKLRDAVLE